MRAKIFLKSVESQRVVAAIRAAESRSRGEIRVHVSKEPVADARAAAAAVFERLGMTATAERSGVLIFVAPETRQLAVIGDRGVHERCGDAFWESVAGAAAAAFREGRFTEGIVAAVERLGDVLAEHFPRAADTPDVDELANELTDDESPETLSGTDRPHRP